MSRITPYLSSGLSYLCIMLISFSAAAAESQRPSGVLALYKSSNSKAPVIDSKQLTALGCAVQLNGHISAEQGAIGIKTPSHFTLLSCKQSSDELSKFSDLFKSAELLAVVEGELKTLLANKQEQELSKRQYVLKLSHYNNLNISKRKQDLKNLNKEAAALKDNYTREAFIAVHQAMGLATPDEVVVMHYQDAETGKRFRENNTALLEKIYEFNQAHLVGSIYYIGAVY